MEKKVDRRVKYTLMVIKNSFIKLLKEKSISKITIKEICEEADINRATFYAHFRDQQDLLHQIESDVMKDIKQFLKSYDFDKNILYPIDATEKILEYIGENAELFSLLLNSNGDIKFHQEVIDIIGKQHFIPIMDSDTLKDDDKEYIFHFLACGAVGSIQMWLNDGMKKPAREMAELILKTAVNGRSSFL